METHLHHRIKEQNMDRFYSLAITASLFGDAGVERRWGRVGTNGQTRLDWYENTQMAQNALSDLVRMKLRKGYVSDRNDNLER